MSSDCYTVPCALAVGILHFLLSVSLSEVEIDSSREMSVDVILFLAMLRTLIRSNSVRMCSSLPAFETLKLSRPSDFVVHVELNRPEKRNSLNNIMWSEIGKCFEDLSSDSNCRVIVLSGAGKLFCAGIDLTSFMSLGSISMSEELDTARKSYKMLDIIRKYQDGFTKLEKCVKPVIAAIHSGCIGGGLNLVAAADIRYGTADCYFSLKEVDIGLAADVGALQRLPPKISNDSWLREIAFTARQIPAKEALEVGLISKMLPDKEQLMTAALELAKAIASKSPVAVQGTKINLNYSRDHSIEEGLEYQATWNMAMLQTEDVVKSAMAAINKEGTPVYSKL